MLKISEMARLADTTRRTLIFYDEAGVFSPAEKNAAGYRYYDYGQLYDLLFILGLRKLGLSISQIKAVQGQATPELGPQLVTIQNRLDQQIAELSRIRSIIDQKVQQQAPTPLPHYVPRLVQRPRQVFWCSTAAASCTEEEVAELFAAFYQQLGDLALMKTGQSGFITDLPEAAPTGYEQAGFRVIKEATAAIPDRALPRIEKPAGQFVVVRVENTTPGICRGLAAIQRLCRDRQLTVTADLWQLNLGDAALTAHGGSPDGQLEYRVKPQVPASR